jgi:predicted TIM-barrel fold metal-dependent hydrolase
LDVDLGSQPVTDIHCFSFAPKTAIDRRLLSNVFLSGGPTVKGFRGEVREADLLSSVAYRRMIKELSLFLRVKGSDTQVLRKRNEQARDFPKYVAALFDDAKIKRAVLDNGIEPVSFEDFRKYSMAKLHRVFRLESLLKKLFESERTFSGLSNSFDEAIIEAVKKRGFIGFKSVIAYRTGLDIRDPQESEARRSFSDYRKGKYENEWFGPRIKPVRDFLLCRAAELSRRLRVFLQIHTGVGDTDVVADRCDPLLLKDFLKLETVSKIPVILIHGGFPYSHAAAWLANVFPNLYFELSTPLPPVFMPALSRARFRDVLEIVPATRIVYGSDAIEIPENHWLSAKLAKKALGGSLAELVDEGVLDEDEAHMMARRIFNDNASILLPNR